MAVEIRRLGGAAAAPLPFRRYSTPTPCRVSSPSTSTISRRLVALGAVKKSPKRLKYSTPRFTKEGGLLYVEVDPFGSDSWKLDSIVELLKEGAVGVIPTDTVYAIACDLRNNSAIERLRRIKDIEPSKASSSYMLNPKIDDYYNLRDLPFWPLSLLCRSFKDIDTYTTGFPRGNGQGLANIFRAVKQCLPGPYTFILTASKALPKQCIRYGTTSSKYASRTNVGVRVPDDAVCKAILEKMDAPLISTSVRSPREDEWILDPVIIADVYGPEGLDFVVAAGTRLAEPSTVVDMTGSSPQIIRQGKGPKQPWMVAEEEEDPSGKNAA
ncbi:hypothetical protein SASPL_151576 [Salvia splendens]|uniref:Threonylcarbamoyl-AMP synthase n=1 Tax=Salvia splendens TaxID=180675 RepID=A0A8X8W8V7_SALSN|nr:hypothetical protein SASPL_151576 [Salvia splendens]